jgi:hypothetical protein
MHAPPYFGFHVFWIWTATELLLAVSVLGGLLTLLSWWGARRSACPALAGGAKLTRYRSAFVG